MDLKDLRYAIAVADAGGFTRAAARLHLAQQALSKQISDLECELDVKLFVRMARGTRLTPAGAVFVEDARTTLAQSQRAVARARGMERQESQLLRVGLLPCSTLTESAVAPLRCFRQRHPRVQIDIIQMAPLALLSGIRDGSLDLAMACFPPDDSGEIGGECVWERPFGAVLPATSPLATQDVMWLRDLVDLPLITFGRETNPVRYDSLFSALAQRGLRPRLADVRAPGPPELVGAFVAEGEGWTLATAEDWWPLYERIPGLVFRHFADPPILAQRWVLSPQDAPSPLVGQFIATCRDLNGGTANAAALVAVDSHHRSSDQQAPSHGAEEVVKRDGARWGR